MPAPSHRAASAMICGGAEDRAQVRSVSINAAQYGSSRCRQAQRNKQVMRSTNVEEKFCFRSPARHTLLRNVAVRDALACLSIG